MALFPKFERRISYQACGGTDFQNIPSIIAWYLADGKKAISLEFGTLAKQIEDSLVQDRLLATLFGIFGGLALLLAMIGLFGSLSYLVTQRQPEFGIRMALGAMPVSILRLVLREVATVAVCRCCRRACALRSQPCACWKACSSECPHATP